MSAPTIEVFVNGEARPLRAGSSIAELLQELHFTSAQVAVERNKLIVRRAEHPTTRLEAGDRIEIVTLFGGG